MMKIQAFEPTEETYEALVLIEKAIWPDNFMTLAELKHFDAARSPDFYYQRLTAAADGRIVAFANYGETPGSYLPGKYRLRINVHPTYERQGIGTAVYNHIIHTLHQRTPAPVLLESGTYEHKPQSIHFLQKRGFKQVMRWIISTLDIQSFDISRFAPLRQKVADAGIAIRPLTVQKELDPHWQQNIYDLDWKLTLDEPLPTPPTKLPLAQYIKQEIEQPNALHDAWYVALDHGRYVGMTQLMKSETDPTRYNTGFTGVVRSHRRRGLATALKTYAIEYAQQRDGRLLRTGNEEHNPMYTLNRHLGFTDLTANLAFEKTLTAPLPG